MEQKEEMLDIDPEISAINIIYLALKSLDEPAQKRVLTYVSGKLNIPLLSVQQDVIKTEYQTSELINNKFENGITTDQEDDFGISPVAKKWMRRNNLKADQLLSIFSLGVDEIDLVAKTVPDRNKKRRMHNVFLLTGIAAYLSTGTSRFTYEKVKETLLHYDAYDAAHFSTYIKELSSEVSGSKDSGYTLTPRGLTSATELIKTILAPKSNMD